MFVVVLNLQRKLFNYMDWFARDSEGVGECDHHQQTNHLNPVASSGMSFSGDSISMELGGDSLL